MLKCSMNVKTIHPVRIQRGRHVNEKEEENPWWARGSFTDTEKGECVCGILGLAKMEDSFREALKLKIHRSNKQNKNM